jgi:hypothetical protein
MYIHIRHIGDATGTVGSPPIIIRINRHRFISNHVGYSLMRTLHFFYLFFFYIHTHTRTRITFQRLCTRPLLYKMISGVIKTGRYFFCFFYFIIIITTYIIIIPNTGIIKTVIIIQIAIRLITRSRAEIRGTTCCYL